MSHQMAEFRVLYTHQKSKKSKVWQDGTLGFTENGRKGTLCDDFGNRLDAVYVRPENVAVGDELESDRHLITIEEEVKPWQPPPSTNVPSKSADSFTAPVVSHGTGDGATTLKPNFGEIRAFGSSSKCGVAPGDETAHRTKLGKRKHLGSQNRDLLGFHRNELRPTAGQEVLDFEIIPSLGDCRNQVDSLERSHHTQGEGHSYSQQKTIGDPVASVKTLRFKPNVTSANSQTGQARRSLGQIMGLLRSKGVPPPPSHGYSAPVSRKPPTHAHMGVALLELLPPPEAAIPTSYLEPVSDHLFTNSRNCASVVESYRSQPVIAPQPRSTVDHDVGRKPVEKVPTDTERHFNDTKVSSVQRNVQYLISEEKGSGISRTLRPLTSQPEDFLSVQSDVFSLSANQPDCAISEAATTAHSVVTLKPLVTSPTDFTLPTSQSDFSFQDAQSIWGSTANESATHVVPTDSDQSECCVDAVPSQKNPVELLVWDSLSEGSNCSETDQSAQDMMNADQSESRDDPKEVIDLTDSQTSYLNQRSRTDQPNYYRNVEYMEPVNELDSLRSLPPNTLPVPQNVPTRRQVGPRMLRKSKQAFNCPYTQSESQPTNQNSTVTPRSKVVVSAPHKGKFRAPLLHPQGSCTSTGAVVSGEQSPGVQLAYSDMGGPLRFPPQHEVTSVPSPLRHTLIPTTFTSAHQYRQVLSVAIREHLNVILFQLASRYHRALTQVDVQGSQISEPGSQKSVPSCKHGPTELRCVKKAGPNKGRLFYVCSASGSAQCKFFKWADEVSKSSSEGQSGVCSGKFHLSTPQEVDVYLKGHQINMYSNCQIVRKCLDFESRGKYKHKGSRWKRLAEEDQPPSKKHLFIALPRKEGSGQYGKDDLWVVSRDLSFMPEGTFLAKSAFYGPTSSNLLEISPISGYSPSNWPSNALAYCIHVGSASSELCCLDNLEDHVTPLSLPILPALLTRSHGASSEESTAARRGFIPPTASYHSNAMVTSDWSDVTALVDEMIGHYHLNADQSEALKQCAGMFKPGSSPTPITLIHGVFGAGKSYLLTVIVLFLVKLFQLQGPGGNSTRPPQKLLISSTTNVAVDRILMGLLDHRFEEFVRVGSVKKIAKPVLPYSIHSSGTESQELKELQDMLKGDISANEKMYVRKSIERHKLGVNKKRLSSVHVVGVTCAACMFPLMADLVFPILLLDECSQMTEPASLLPMARFGCEKCVLVGDPKQLAPPIQGSDSAHQSGLEQTLFERLVAMGYNPVVLRTQYRCHPTLSAISNSLFYDGQLVDGVSHDQRQPLLPHLPTLCFLNVSNGREQSAPDGSYYNTEESKVVVDLLESLLDADIPPASIGVITLYKAQMRHIRTELCNSRSGSDLKSIQISTVDAFQGGEKEVIILSSVRTQHVGFIDSDRRTNVALTRAKRHLLILGNQRMLSTNEVWGHVIRHCQSTPGSVQQATQFLQLIKKETTTHC